MISKLKESIERKFGDSISTKSDCIKLALKINEELGCTISYNTLRRFFGIIRGGEATKATLNLLSKYIGCNSFDSFLESPPEENTAFDFFYKTKNAVSSVEASLVYEKITIGVKLVDAVFIANAFKQLLEKKEYDPIIYLFSNPKWLDIILQKEAFLSLFTQLCGNDFLSIKDMAFIERLIKESHYAAVLLSFYVSPYYSNFEKQVKILNNHPKTKEQLVFSSSCLALCSYYRNNTKALVKYHNIIKDNPLKEYFPPLQGRIDLLDLLVHQDDFSAGFSTLCKKAQDIPLEYINSYSYDIVTWLVQKEQTSFLNEWMILFRNELLTPYKWVHYSSKDLYLMADAFLDFKKGLLHQFKIKMAKIDKSRWLNTHGEITKVFDFITDVTQNGNCNKV